MPTSERKTQREIFAGLGVMPYHHYHDDKGKQWLVVDCEDSIVCLVPDDVLVLPGGKPVAEEFAKKIAELLCEDYFQACEANGL